MTDRTDSGVLAARLFEATFARAPEGVAHAPGRVNLIGEHTDYSGGFVLPMAIPQRTYVAIARRDDKKVRAVSKDAPSVANDAPAGCMTFELGAEARTGTWIDYVQGTLVGLRAAGHDIAGFDVAFASAVPIGAGLSSSAALEIALLRAVREVFALAVDDVAIAKIGRAAETDFVGAPIGIMDQMAASLAEDSGALFIDTRELTYERVVLPSSIEIVVIDSGVSHGHATGDYAKRHAECERAAELLGVPMLRDVTASDHARIAALPAPLDRRARHVVSENARVLAAVECLRSGAIAELGKLFDASHESLRSDFEVSVPEVDRLVALAQRDESCIGARMTGGGFGGAIVALARAGEGATLARRVVEAYGHGGRVLVPVDDGSA